MTNKKGNDRIKLEKMKMIFMCKERDDSETANPAPYPIIDEWNYGVNDNYGYSNYYVKSPGNVGSKSSATNIWGTVKASDSKKYGWALSSSQKSWNDVRLNAHWNYFYF